jgi:DNA-directed RNA polymerase alpha subunit
MKGTLRVCPKGHNYYKSSDCPTCPVCDEERKPDEGFLSMLTAPARRALETAVIKSVGQLSAWTKNDLLKLHGIGPTTIPKLKEALKSEGYSFARMTKR